MGFGGNSIDIYRLNRRESNGRFFLVYDNCRLENGK